MISGISIAIGILNYNHFDDFVASRLFRSKKDHRGSGHEVSELQPTRYFNSCMCLLDTLPTKLRCCKKSRKQRSLEKARDIIDQEFNVIKIVQAHRYFRKALELVLVKKKRLELLNECEVEEIDPSSGSSGSGDEKKDYGDYSDENREKAACQIRNMMMMNSRQH